MQINPLFKENELINLQTYLNKYNIQNIKDFISPPIQYIENPMLQVKSADFYEWIEKRGR